MLLLMVWNVLTFWPKQHTKVDIPYTEFLSQVRSDNVTSVQISGDEIAGTFAKPIEWPRPERGSPGHAQAAEAPAPPAKAPSTSEKAQAKSQSSNPPPPSGLR